MNTGEALVPLGLPVVIKIGTSSLIADGRLRVGLMARLTDVVLAIKASGRDVVLVSSGAVGAGCIKMGLKERPTSVAELQALAAIGQQTIMASYGTLLESAGVQCGQILLTYSSFGVREEYLHAREALHGLLRLGCIPIVNENDAVAVDELKTGDNDTLAALVASLVQASELVLLTDVDALYTANPQTDPTAQRIPFVRADQISSMRTRFGGHGVRPVPTGVVPASAGVASSTSSHIGRADAAAVGLGTEEEAGAAPHVWPRHRAVESGEAAAAGRTGVAAAGVPPPGLSRASSATSSPWLAAGTATGPREGSSRRGSVASTVDGSASVVGSASVRPAQQPSPRAADAPSAAAGGAGPGRSGRWGTGGIETKLKAAQLASACGCSTLIASAADVEKLPSGIASMASNRQASLPFGTLLAAQPKRAQGRKRWILGLRARGQIVLDGGAVRAVCRARKSLFAAGVVAVRSQFDKYDGVALMTQDGVEVARAIVNYSSEEVARILGCNSMEIANRLGYTGDDTVAHRDNIVPFDRPAAAVPAPPVVRPPPERTLSHGAQSLPSASIADRLAASVDDRSVASTPFDAANSVLADTDDELFPPAATPTPSVTQSLAPGMDAGGRGVGLSSLAEYGAERRRRESVPAVHPSDELRRQRRFHGSESPAAAWKTSAPLDAAIAVPEPSPALAGGQTAPPLKWRTHPTQEQRLAGEVAQLVYEGGSLPIRMVTQRIGKRIPRSQLSIATVLKGPAYKGRMGRFLAEFSSLFSLDDHTVSLRPGWVQRVHPDFRPGRLVRQLAPAGGAGLPRAPGISSVWGHDREDEAQQQPTAAEQLVGELALSMHAQRLGPTPERELRGLLTRALPRGTGVDINGVVARSEFGGRFGRVLFAFSPQVFVWRGEGVVGLAPSWERAVHPDYTLSGRIGRQRMSQRGGAAGGGGSGGGGGGSGGGGASRPGHGV